MSAFINSTLVARLISANPGLRVLEWRRTLKDCTLQELADLKGLLPLRRPRYLDLDGWNLQTTSLYYLLGYNAERFEELRIKNCNFVVPMPAMRNDKGKLSVLFANSSEEAIEAFQAMWKKRGSV